MKVLIIGAGKVGRALASAGRRHGHRVVLRPARRGVPSRPMEADLWVLAVRDGQLEALAVALASSGCVSPGAAIVHLAGSLGPETLRPIADAVPGASVAQMHPMLAFADPKRPPELKGGHALLAGDAPALRVARRFCKDVGLVPRIWPAVDPVRYHCAGALLANGSVALAQVAAELLESAGVSSSDCGRVLGPLLRSVAAQIEDLGLPAALTGPIRRGDAGTVARQWRAVRELPATSRALYRASARVQLKISTLLGEAPKSALADVAVVLRR